MKVTRFVPCIVRLREVGRGSVFYHREREAEYFGNMGGNAEEIAFRPSVDVRRLTG